MRKFKIGDTVRCVENGAAIKPHALGYKPGKEFVVDSIHKSSDGEYIYFPKNDLGVYECDLILVKEPVKELPKSFGCTNTNQKLWDKYIKWLNAGFAGDVNIYYGFDTDGIKTSDNIKGSFDTILSLKEWDEIVNPNSKELPKSFACTNTNQKLWDKFIKWLNKKFNASIAGKSLDWPYYGITANGVYDCHKSIDYYDTILSLEEWDEIVNGTETKKEETMKNYTITREQLKKIHDVACGGWKEKITEYAGRNPFGNTIEFTQEEVVAMFVASSLSQRTVLEGIFGKQIKELDFQSDNINFEVDGISVFGISNMKSDESFIGLPRANHPNSFFLNPDYVWTLDDDVLKVTRK